MVRFTPQLLSREESISGWGLRASLDALEKRNTSCNSLPNWNSEIVRPQTNYYSEFVFQVLVQLELWYQEGLARLGIRVGGQRLDMGAQFWLRNLSEYIHVEGGQEYSWTVGLSLWRWYMTHRILPHGDLWVKRPVMSHKCWSHFQILGARKVTCSNSIPMAHNYCVTCEPNCHLTLFNRCLSNDKRFYVRKRLQKLCC